jgi:hypothetical protein
MPRVIRVALTVLITATAGLAYPGKVTVPFDVQVPLVLKALTYDRNLKTRAIGAEQVRIAIIVAKGGKDSAADLNASLGRLSGRTVNGLAVVFTEIEAGDDQTLETKLGEGQWAAAYVMPGLAPADLARVRRLCEARHVLSVAAIVDDLEHGLAFGIGAADGHPQIVINLPASKACGSDFDLALLQLSKVLR